MFLTGNYWQSNEFAHVSDLPLFILIQSISRGCCSAEQYYRNVELLAFEGTDWHRLCSSVLFEARQADWLTEWYEWLNDWLAAASSSESSSVCLLMIQVFSPSVIRCIISRYLLSVSQAHCSNDTALEDYTVIHLQISYGTNPEVIAIIILKERQTDRRTVRTKEKVTKWQSSLVSSKDFPSITWPFSSRNDLWVIYGQCTTALEMIETRD